MTAANNRLSVQQLMRLGATKSVAKKASEIDFPNYNAVIKYIDGSKKPGRKKKNAN